MICRAYSLPPSSYINILLFISTFKTTNKLRLISHIFSRNSGYYFSQSHRQRQRPGEKKHHVGPLFEDHGRCR